MRLLAIDTGNEKSAFVLLEGEQIIDKGILPNDEMIVLLSPSAWSNRLAADHLAIEMIASYGMAVGVTVFETCLWIGRFMQAYGASHTTKVYRKDVKMHLCGSTRAKDGNIRQALLDRYNNDVGNKKAPGRLYGVSKDVWAALAVGLTYLDTRTSARDDV